MNIIEQLGGYNKAKTKFRDNGSLHAERMKRLLLEYRREHNIFEVGDLVTHLTTKSILKIVNVGDLSKHYRLMKVEALSPKNNGSVSDCFNGFWFQFKHATDEEIKAGHRL